MAERKKKKAGPGGKKALKKKTTRKPVKPASRRKKVKKRSKSSKRVTVAILEKRILLLEAEFKDLQPRRRRGLYVAADKTLTFTKSHDSPDLTRLSVEGIEVIGFGETEGRYTAAAGAPLAAWMEISGSPGNVATIAVTNSVNQELVLEMPAGRFSTNGPYTIWVED